MANDPFDKADFLGENVALVPLKKKFHDRFAHILVSLVFYPIL